MPGLVRPVLGTQEEDGVGRIMEQSEMLPTSVGGGRQCPVSGTSVRHRPLNPSLLHRGKQYSMSHV